MDAIANDPATFERWMGLVETAHTLELGNFAADAAHVESSSTSVNEDSPSLLSQFVSFIGDHVRGLMAAGGAMGMAAVALVFLLPRWHGLKSKRTVRRLWPTMGVSA